MRRPFIVASFLSLSLALLPCLVSISPAQELSETRRQIVSQVVPGYPELASKMRISGTVKLEIMVASNGRVKATQVIGGSPILVKAAVDSVEKWRWAPSPQETKE